MLLLIFHEEEANMKKRYEELTFADDFMFFKIMQSNPDNLPGIDRTYNRKKGWTDHKAFRKSCHESQGT